MKHFKSNQGFGLLAVVVIISVVVIIGVGTAVLLKRLSDIPPLQREAQIQQGTLPGQGYIWPDISSNGIPPNFDYVQGVDTLPTTLDAPQPITDPCNPDGPKLTRFSMTLVQPAATVAIWTSCSMSGFSGVPILAGTGTTNLGGWTNDSFRVWRTANGWNWEPVKPALTNQPNMFLRIEPR
mgnify:CR=1 FL=1